MREKIRRKFRRYRKFYNKVSRVSVIGLKTLAYKRVKAVSLVYSAPLGNLRLQEIQGKERK